MIKYLFLLFLYNICSAAGEGTSSGLSLMFPISAKYLAMGEISSVITSEIENLFANPATSGDMKWKQLTTSISRGIVDTVLFSANFGFPVEAWKLSCGGVYYTAGEVELIDIYGNSRFVNAQRDFILYGSISGRYSKDFSVGANIKLLHSSLVEEFHSTAFSIDLGGIYEWKLKLKKKKIRKFYFSLSILNIGSRLRYIQEKEPLPFAIRLGSAYPMKLKGKKKLLLGLDIVKFRHAKTRLYGGCEYSINDRFHFRSGFQLGYYLRTISFGFGFKSERYKIDAGFLIFGTFSQRLIISFTYYLLPW